MGVRAVSRFTSLHRDTVLSILESAGEKCAEFLDVKIHDVKAENVQVDEIHTFVGCKAKQTTRDDMERGDFFTFLSVDRASKLIINWHTSKRDKENTLVFMKDLERRMQGRFQLTTDEYWGYWRGNGAVVSVFGAGINYATEKKIFGLKFPNDISRWKNPMIVTAIKRQCRIGTPDMAMATTCHAERTNLSVRTFTRRFTRATLGFSKKLENLRHAVALFVCHFNFVRKHGAHGQTPGQAAGLTDKAWSIDEILTATI
jgi:IS1 family transposase